KENVEFDRFYYPVGYGKQRPVASNETREGRAMNRRVDFIIYTTESEPPIPEGSAIKSVEKLDEKTVKIVCNGRVNNYQDSFISNPDRIILDFPGIFLLTTQKTFDISNDVFIRARAAFHHDDRYSRIVLDLRSPVQYRVITKDNNIYVREL
ncbi:MAG: AMIN domain-containing protein, partial [bacterium]|nr:AMIN domain-containing protein [bacterium]